MKNSIEDQVEQEQWQYNEDDIDVEVNAGKGKSDYPEDGTGKESWEKGEKEAETKMVSSKFPPARVHVDDGEDVEVVEGLDQGEEGEEKREDWY